MLDFAGHGRRLPATAATWDEGRGGWFPAVKRDMKSLSKVNQNWGCCFTVDSYQSLLILLNLLKAYKKILSV